MAPSAQAAIPLRRQPAFLLFSLARVGSRAGAQGMSVAIGWQMYQLTGSPLDLGLVALVEFLPAAGLMLVAGQVADRFGRRSVSRIAQVVQAVLAIALATASAMATVTPSLLYVLVFALGAARAFEAPALQALLPDVVAADDLPRAIAASSAVMQCALVAAPALGGLAYLAGAPLAYGLCALLFGGAAVAMSFLRARGESGMAHRMTIDSLLGGVRYVRSHPVLLGALTLDLFVVLLGSATALLPVFARDVLAAGPGGLGLLRAAPAVGAFAMSVWLARHSTGGSIGRKMFAAAAVFGLSIIVFGLSDCLLLSLAALVVLGASDMLGAVIRSTLVQIGTPDDMRGRVSAVNALVVGTSNQLGDFEAGLTASWWGARPAVVLGGIGTLCVCALWIRWFPALYARDRLER